MKVEKLEYQNLMNPFIKYRNACGMHNEAEENRLKLFFHFCETNYPDESVISQEMIDKWSEKRKTETAHSRNCRIRLLCAFIRYLNKKNKGNYIIPKLLKETNPKSVPHSFTNEELSNFFYQCDNLREINTPEIKLRKLIIPAFYRLLYSTGMRPIEARCLLRENVNFDDNYMDIKESKGGNQHFVALHPTMTEILKSYDSSVDKLQPNRKYFFQSVTGEPFTTRWVIRTFHTIWEKANGKKDYVIPYDFRHNYAISNINSWQNDNFDFNEKIFFLSKSMGHREVESTLHYYSLIPRLADTIRKNTEKDFNKIIPEVNYEEE